MSEGLTGSRAFLGKGWGFPPEFHRHAGDLRARMAQEEEDIREALAILFSTTPGERVMQPTFGCGLRGMVFDEIGEATTAEIINIVERAVLFFEHRITLERVDVTVEDELEGKILIELVYLIRETNTRSNMVYPFYYQEGTEIDSGVIAGPTAEVSGVTA